MFWPTLACTFAIAAVIATRRGRRRADEAEARLRRLERDTAQADAQHRGVLAQLEAQQEAVFNSMIEGVLLLDASQRVQWVNRALQDLTGLSQDVRRQTLLETFQMHQLKDLVARVTAERQVRDFELDWPGPPVARTLRINAAALTDNTGRSHGSVLVFHDTTRLKHLENTRQEFVANVSHELRTPLSVIKGYVETLLDGAKNDPALVDRFLQTILKHVDRLTFLIDDLLTISHLESGRTVLNRQTLSLHALGDRVTEDLRSRAAEKKMELRNQIPEALQASADADRLQQVIFNLMDNAIKYGHAGGWVTLGAAPAKANVPLTVWVKDDGCGIPHDSLERIFERFYRVDRARSRDQGGTGLGLSIVKHIVQSHGGRVWAESTLGLGSTFSFTLPPEPDPAREAAVPTLSPQPTPSPGHA